MHSDAAPSLIVLGVVLIVLGYIEPGLTPLIMIGLSMIAVGLLAYWDEGSLEQVIAHLASAAWDNVAALVESAGLVNKGVYLPSSISNGEVSVLIPSAPIDKVGKLSVVGKPLAIYGPGLRGLLLSSPGSRAVAICRDAGALTSDLTVSLSNCIVNQLSLAKSIDVAESGGEVAVRLSGLRPIDLYGDSIIRVALGSTLASIVASVAAEVINKPIMIKEESTSGRSLLVRLGVINNA
ncbi:hypothetical protein [Caldivirga sp. UBA161]|uniref:hypothetical protein n=1 Tax=Caldivirga sp. UBA161 TaxID=1915569 RepID=UPI0025C17F16|nr:hypothetical protein [Caldivirga sp. UBA161]